MNLEYDLLGVEGLLDYFDIEKTRDLITEQLNADSLTPGGRLTDHLQPLWARYSSLEHDHNGLDPSVYDEVKAKFDSICLMFIDYICKKYGLSLDEGWLENMNRSEIHGLAVMLYSFFVIDMENLILEVLIKYIDANVDMLATQFGDNLKARKDAAYISLKKIVDSRYAVIGASIYDVCYWILDQMSENEFFDHIDGDYIPLTIIAKWFDDMHINGEFMQKIYEIFKNSDWKSRICFNLITNIKKRHPKV